MPLLSPPDRRCLVVTDRRSISRLFGLPALVVALTPSLAACSARESGTESGIRPPAVAGQFYPDSSAKLKAAVEAFLRDAKPPRGSRPIGLIVPHAGYVYSGQITADAFRQAAEHTYATVVILGANHTTAGFQKIALPVEKAFRTPLGIADVDAELVAALLKACPDCSLDSSPHVREHSIEVQLPFVQHLFPQARIVPAIVGTNDPEICRRFGEALARVLEGREALIVASSDLSHYPDAAGAAATDRRTLDALAKLDAREFQSSIEASMRRGVSHLETAACGEAPILAALAAARARGARCGVTISYAHSGLTTLGDSSRVVGYGAVAMFDEQGCSAVAATGPPPTGAARSTLPLLAFARESITRLLETDTIPLPRGLEAWQDVERGAFVTLKKKGDLRGCIGRIIPDQKLPQLVGRVALESAVRDPRFPPLRREELRDVEMELSLLTPLQPVKNAFEIVPGRDGVLLEKAGKSAVFLPQVATEQGWGRNELLDNLCVKADLRAGCWRGGARLQVFQAEITREKP